MPIGIINPYPSSCDCMHYASITKPIGTSLEHSIKLLGNVLRLPLLWLRVDIVLALS